MPPCRYGFLQSNLNAKRWKTRVELSEFLESARLMLDVTPLRRINLDEICHEIGLSKHHFVRLFHEAFGQPPLAYATSKALERAAKSLLETQKSIGDIAYETGFSDSTTFGRAFVRAFSQAPSQYRRSAKNSVSPIVNSI